jgi:hypothetical protein
MPQNGSAPGVNRGAADDADQAVGAINSAGSRLRQAGLTEAEFDELKARCTAGVEAAFARDDRCDARFCSKACANRTEP